MKYIEKLKDPRWQKKRLEIFQKANFKCEYCTSAKDTLHVHHKTYFKDRDPWEYSNYFLICLCYECHQWLEDLKTEVKRSVDLLDYFQLRQVKEVLELLYAPSAVCVADVGSDLTPEAGKAWEDKIDNSPMGKLYRVQGEIRNSLPLKENE
jgi:glutaredoxin